jgi:predicted deacylase
MMRAINVGTASSTSVGRVDGMLRIGWLPDGLPMETPVTIVRGPEDGHVLWIHGCVHGNEYCGTFTIHKFLRDLEPGQLRGAVVALPALNITAFQKNQRMSPFEGFHGGDLNRCFPGKPEGTVTEQMAFHIYNPLREYATHFVDFHTALTEDTRWALFAPAGNEVAESMARAFGFRHTLPAPLDILGGSAMITAAKNGIPSLIVEAGGIGPAFSPETVEDAAERLGNVLRRLHMLPGPVTDHGAMTFFSNFAWVNTTRGGLFRPAVKCGQPVEKGDVVGRYYDLHGELVEEGRAPASGIVLAINNGPLMPGGEILVHIGLEPRAV